jgi:hypothetical protein
VSDLGWLEPGNPVRLPHDAREIPTLRHLYGEVPIVYASAGVRRIITLAYLIVWAWEEQKIQAKLIRKEPQNRIEEAKTLQLQENPQRGDVSSVSERLIKYLAPDDEFWPRWKYFAEKHGVRFDPHPSTT